MAGFNVRSNWVVRVGKGLLAGFLALLSFIPFAYASASPSGWDVQIESYTRGPNYVRMDVDLPAGATGINFYEYSNSYDNPYNVQRNSALPAQNSDGTYTVFIYNMLGGGYPTYLKMTYDDSNGDESPLPANFFILQLDVAVYLDGISPDTLAKLQSALANLQDAVGVNSAVSAGQTIQQGFSGMSGFSTAGSGDLAFTVPITYGGTVAGKSLSGINVTLFTSAQLAQLGWLSTLRDVCVAALWIAFGMYLVRRFAPVFKV